MTPITEDQALRKACPFKHTAKASQDIVLGVITGRVMHLNGGCAAAACMAWRFTSIEIADNSKSIGVCELIDKQDKERARA